MRIVVIILSFVLVITISAQAEDKKDSHSMVVQGYSLERIERSLRKIFSSEKNHQVAKWHKSLCISTVGMSEKYASILIERVKAAASLVNEDVLTSCDDKNVIIFVSSNSDKIVKELSSNPDQFIKSVSEITNSSLNNERPDADEINNFLIRRPIRWFFTDHIFPKSGSFIEKNTPISKGIGVPVLSSYNTTMLFQQTYESIERALIFVDIDLCSGLNMDSLSDYIAMVILSHPTLGANFPTNSVLSLLNKPINDIPKKYYSITNFDKSALKELYYSRDDLDANDFYRFAAENIFRSNAFEANSETSHE